MIQAETIVEESNSYKIISKGIVESATALTSLIGKNVSVVGIQKSHFSDHPFDFLESEESHVLLLKTELVGPVVGINYLILARNDATAISSSVFSDSLIEEQDSQITIEFLKEMENVLAASTITHIADSIERDMYGDVPKIQAAKKEMIGSIIQKEVSQINPEVVYHSNYSIPDLGISPKIVWFFDRSFYEVCENDKAVMV